MKFLTGNPSLHGSRWESVLKCCVGVEKRASTHFHLFEVDSLDCYELDVNKIETTSDEERLSVFIMKSPAIAKG